jgi:hypothetical protein
MGRAKLHGSGRNVKDSQENDILARNSSVPSSSWRGRSSWSLSSASAPRVARPPAPAPAPMRRRAPRHYPCGPGRGRDHGRGARALRRLCAALPAHARRMQASSSPVPARSMQVSLTGQHSLRPGSCRVRWHDARGGWSCVARQPRAHPPDRSHGTAEAWRNGSRRRKLLHYWISTQHYRHEPGMRMLT